MYEGKFSNIYLRSFFITYQQFWELLQSAFNLGHSNHFQEKYVCLYLITLSDIHILYVIHGVKDILVLHCYLCFLAQSRRAAVRDLGLSLF